MSNPWSGIERPVAEFNVRLAIEQHLARRHRQAGGGAGLFLGPVAGRCGRGGRLRWR